MGNERRIRFDFANESFSAVLLDTSVADAIWNALPITAEFTTWGDEIYFDSGVDVAPTESQETVALGDVGYWPPGRAVCLFYGPTPISTPDEIRPAGPVAIFARLQGDFLKLKSVQGRRMTVTRLDPV